MSAPSKTRILLADDHLLVRHGLRMVLNAAPDLEVGAGAGDGAEAVELATRDHVLHLAILDVAMPRMTGLQAAAELSRRRPGLKVLMSQCTTTSSTCSRRSRRGLAAMC
jgi:DNA-binding NarL/FixJ family response regulator